MNNIEQYIGYDATSGVLTWLKNKANIKAGSVAGCINRSGYLVVQFNGKLYYCHRLAWYLHYGVWPENQIDHIDQDKTNNKIENLRDVSHRINNQNKENFNGGVSFDPLRNKWRAAAQIGGKNIFFGRFPSREEAQEAYENGTKGL